MLFILARLFRLFTSDCSVWSSKRTGRIGLRKKRNSTRVRGISSLLWFNIWSEIIEGVCADESIMYLQALIQKLLRLQILGKEKDRRRGLMRFVFLTGRDTSWIVSCRWSGILIGNLLV